MTIHEEDVPFARVEGRPLLGRLYRPEGVNAFPLLVDVHGGAWVNGDRLNNAVIHRALAERGIGIFALDFRMPPEARFPAAVRDVNAGIRWVLAQAATLGTAPGKVGGLGTSSGAHLLMVNALQPDHPEFVSADAGADARLGYVVAGWPILDPLARYHMATARSLAKLVKAHHDFWPDEAAMGRANPQLILERGEQQRHLPKVLVLQGTADENVEPHRAERFAIAYRAAGGEARVESFAGEPHAFMLNHPPSSAFDAALALIVEFVRSNA
jgi:acetyl esterase/lipase